MALRAETALILTPAGLMSCESHTSADYIHIFLNNNNTIYHIGKNGYTEVPAVSRIVSQVEATAKYNHFRGAWGTK